MRPFVPELLAPAGNLEKCKIALLYGADAVYLSGQKFGLRAGAANLCDSELREALHFAHQLQKKVYVTLNGFLHQKDLDELPDFVRFLDEIQTDAVIVSDLGVFEVVRKHSQIPIHISTQASVVNLYAAKLWKKLGATRIIVGRELSIQEASSIRKQAPIEIEMFVHGALCMSYSGNCVISNYTAGRDSNRGGCKQSCRFEYSLQKEEEQHRTFFMSSKDLNGIQSLPEFLKYQITSLKIEGRMKSNLYVATLVKAYRKALNQLQNTTDLATIDLTPFYQMTEETSHRDYTEASLATKAGADSILLEKDEETAGHTIIGTLLEIKEDYALAALKNPIPLDATVEVLPFQGDTISIPVIALTDIKENQLTKFNPNTIVRLPYSKGMEALNLLRVAPCSS